MANRSLIGLLLAGGYTLLSVVLIVTQGIFGESFIALILGMPWSLAFAFIEFGNAPGAILFLMLLLPMILNAFILYGVGVLLEKIGRNNALLIICVATLLLIAGFFVLNSYIYAEKQRENPGESISYRGTLTGEYVCLPHRDTDGPQTLECAFGIKTDVGEYYALDLGTLSQEQPDLQTGDRFTATGLIIPLVLLSTDHWSTYDIEGVFSVTDSVQKL